MKKGLSLKKEAARVIDNDNCTGCGACALVSSRVSIEMNDRGFLRPSVLKTDDIAKDNDEALLFRATCPGVVVKARRREAKRYDETFGSYVSAWQGSATDAETRFSGSSGGVLTALAGWLTDSGRVGYAVGSMSAAWEPRRTVPVRITTKAEALAAAGSRYAPVSNLVTLAQGIDAASAVISKPCEATALWQYQNKVNAPQEDRPIVLSFFCAGTPSQAATDRLVRNLGVDPGNLASLRYRGNGWPGDFTAEDTAGATGTLSYDDSWGKHLGRDLQWRCKICPDGTGEHSDISVGDFWHSDEKGYPIFDDAAGNSAVIARTQRGHDILLAAVEAGVIQLQPIDLVAVARIQPLQRNRRRTIAVRLLARRLAGKHVPSYRGYASVVAAAMHPKLAMKTFLGTFLRSIRSRNSA